MEQCQTGLCPLCAELKSDNILHSTKKFSVIFNKYPYSPGHVMIISNKHLPALQSFTVAERSELMELIVKVQEKIFRATGKQSMNIGINEGPDSGASIPEHFHVHLVPRHDNDFGFYKTIVNKIPERNYIENEKILREF